MNEVNDGSEWALVNKVPRRSPKVQSSCTSMQKRVCLNIGCPILRTTVSSRVKTKWSRFKTDRSRTPCRQQLSAMQLLEITHRPPIPKTGPPNAFSVLSQKFAHIFGTIFPL